MKKAVITIGPVADAAAWAKAERGEIEPGRWYYNGASVLHMEPGTPLVIDHNLEQQVGVVDQLVNFTDASGTWLTARATVTDPPEWLRRGTGASVKFEEIVSHPFGAGTRFGGGKLLEVTLASPSEKPRERTAQVMLLKDVVAAPPRRTLSRDERELAELWRRVDAGQDVEDAIHQLRREFGYTPWWQDQVAV